MTTLAERFWSKVDTSAGPEACWPWLSTRIPTGYGQFWMDRCYRSATHVAVELDGRTVTPGRFVLHRCDNPPCVNPTHLIVGTAGDNSRDSVAKGRAAGPRNLKHYRGDQSPRALLTQAQVAEIRAAYTGKHGQMAAMARRYDVHRSTIAHVLKGISW